MVTPRRSDRITPKSRQKIYYTDFTTNFDNDATTGSLIKLTNEDAIKNSVKNLILTIVGERFYHPNIGSTINASLFEPNDEITSSLIQSSIEQAIRNNEPRAQNPQVSVEPDPVHNAINVKVFFQAINITDPQSVEISVQRVR